MSKGILVGGLIFLAAAASPGIAETVTIAERYQSCRDTKDNKFLDLAVNGRAEMIITGDADLLVLGAFRDIPIIAPVTFLRAYYPGRLA